MYLNNLFVPRGSDRGILKILVMQINGTNGAMLISTTLSFIGVGASEGDYGIYVLPPDHIIELAVLTVFICEVD